MVLYLPPRKRCTVYIESDPRAYKGSAWVVSIIRIPRDIFECCSQLNGVYMFFFSSKKQPMFRLLDFHSKLKQSEVVPHYCLFCRNITDTSYSFAEILQIHPTVLQKYYRHILQFCRNITDTSYSFAEILQIHPTVLQKYYRHILQFCRNITDTSYSFAE